MNQRASSGSDRDLAGFLVVDKPRGITSHDVVARVRRATNITRVGHAGTLDPLATGVVVVGIGRATRLIRFVQNTVKEYLATALFGVATDSLDADGSETERAEFPVTLDRLRQVATEFHGEIDQIPPMVSALKHDGERLYDLARRGVEIDRPARRVVIHELDVQAVGAGPYPSVDFRVACGSGTYVRSLADDMARSLGGRAHLTALRRTRVGGLTLEQAVAVDDLDRWREVLIPPAQALDHLPQVLVDEATESLVLHGRGVDATRVSVPPGHVVVSADDARAVRMMDPSGNLLAVYRIEDERLLPDVVMVG